MNPLDPMELTEEEAAELDALRERPSAAQGKTFQRVPLQPCDHQIAYDEHPDDGQFHRPAPK